MDKDSNSRDDPALFQPLPGHNKPWIGALAAALNIWNYLNCSKFLIDRNAIWTMANIFPQPCDEGGMRARETIVPCARVSEPWILAATSFGSSMAFIDSTVVNVALPTLQKNLNATVLMCSGWSNPTRFFLAALLLPAARWATASAGGASSAPASLSSRLPRSALAVGRLS